MTFGRNIQRYSRIEFACFSFCVGLLFFTNFPSFKQVTENNANSENFTLHCLSTWCHSVKKLAHLLDTASKLALFSVN